MSHWELTVKEGTEPVSCEIPPPSEPSPSQIVSVLRLNPLAAAKPTRCAEFSYSIKWLHFMEFCKLSRSQTVDLRRVFWCFRAVTHKLCISYFLCTSRSSILIIWQIIPLSSQFCLLKIICAVMSKESHEDQSRIMFLMC